MLSYRYDVCFLLLTVVTSTIQLDDPQLLIPVSLKACYDGLKSTQLQSSPNTLQIQEPLLHDLKFGKLPRRESLIIYLDMFTSCFYQLWNFCIEPRFVQQQKKLDTNSNFPCRKLHVTVQLDAIIYHTITTRSTFQINLTFTQFVLRRSYSGCTMQHVEVCCNR